MGLRRVVLVNHYPGITSSPFVASVGSISGEVTTEFGNTEVEAIENLRLRLAADAVAEYPKRVKVDW